MNQPPAPHDQFAELDAHHWRFHTLERRSSGLGRAHRHLPKFAAQQSWQFVERLMYGQDRFEWDTGSRSQPLHNAIAPPNLERFDYADVSLEAAEIIDRLRLLRASVSGSVTKYLEDEITSRFPTRRA